MMLDVIVIFMVLEDDIVELLFRSLVQMHSIFRTSKPNSEP